MRVALVVGIAIILIVAGLGTYALRTTETNPDDNVVALLGMDGTPMGAGVVVDVNGGILTAAHVAKFFGDKNISIRLNYKTDYRDESTVYVVGRVVWASDAVDLAYIQVDAVTFRSAARIEQRYDVGDRVEVIGHPRGNEWLHSWGNIQKLRIMGNPGHAGAMYWMLPVDAAAAPGNSGGGVFNEDGELIGILTLSWMSMFESAGPMSMAVPSDVICRLLLCK